MPEVSLAKLSRPRLGHVHARGRLFDRLDDGRAAASAVWISGPPGSGKTTLVAHYLSERRLPAMWYQVDPGDGDPASFFYHLGHAVRQAGLVQDLQLPLLRPEYLPDLGGFAARFFDALYAALRRPAALVFDNAQDAPDASPFAALLHQAIASAPDGIDVIVMSRQGPPDAAPPIVHIDWPQLRLTPDESLRIAAAALPDERAGIERLVQRCDGWVAGLTLLIQQARADRSIVDAAVAIEPGQALFDYFAAELFGLLPPPSRHLLLRTALLPWVDTESAERLGGDGSATSLLESLHRHHLFVERSDDSRATYRYHALFQEFLVARMRETFTPSERIALAHHSAHGLERAGEPGAALRLYLEAGDDARAARLVLSRASELAAQGRMPTLAAWISMLPASLVAEEPWLAYWQGLCVFGMNPPLARQRLQAAFERFGARDDVLGQTLAAAGIAESFYVEYRDFKATDRWTTALRDLLARRPAFPDAGTELQVLASLLGALAMRQRHPALLAPHAQRMRVLLELPSDVNARVFGAARLLHHAVFFEDRAAAERLIAYVEPLLHDTAVAPLNTCMVLHMRGMFHMFSAFDPAQASRAMEQAVELMEGNGLHFLSIVFHSLAAFARLSAGAGAGAGAVAAGAAHLARVVPALDGSNFDMGWYDGMQSYLALLRDQPQVALQHAQRVVAANIASGMEHGLGLALLLRANALAAGGDLDAAIDDIERAKHHVTPVPFGQFSLLIVEGDVRLKKGDSTSALAVLRQAFATGREADLHNTMLWLPAQMSRLCSFSLAHDIEPGHVTRLIHHRDLRPPDADVPAWPWPVRIRCLGALDIQRDGQSLRFEGKGQRKPLALLKALLALGAVSVPQDVLIETVWPEPVEGDAQQAFDVTVHRLRKLLGHDRSVLVGDHRLSLNPEIVWLDLWVLDRKLGAPTPMAPDAIAPVADLERSAPSMLDLYRGQFLAGEADSAWIVPVRTRLRSRFLRFVLQLGEHWEADGQRARAVALYQHVLAIDPQAEVLHRQLSRGPGTNRGHRTRSC